MNGQRDLLGGGHC